MKKKITGAMVLNSDRGNRNVVALQKVTVKYGR
jgi:hypothetical protein